MSNSSSLLFCSSVKVSCLSLCEVLSNLCSSEDISRFCCSCLHLSVVVISIKDYLNCREVVLTFG